MFFGSAHSNIPDSATPRGTFLRDLAASVATLGALGALLVVIQFNSGEAVASRAPRAVVQQQAAAAMVARQPSDQAAIPTADEERVANAVMAFALTKVSPGISPLQPESIASMPAVAVPAFSPVKKPARPQAALARNNALRIPAGIGQSSYRQAEWPAQNSTLRYATLSNPAAASAESSRFSLVRLEVGRFVPSSQSVVNGAQSLAVGARKSVGAGVAGLRNGVSAVQERAIAISARLW